MKAARRALYIFMPMTLVLGFASDGCMHAGDGTLLVDGLMSGASRANESEPSF